MGQTKLRSTQINNNGWIDAEETWTYASATTITVPSGAASKYSVGDKFKLTANSVVLYGYIRTVADTLLTVCGNPLTNHVFSATYYSKEATPLGFPHWFSYTPTVTALTVGNGTWATSKFIINGRKGDIILRFVYGSTSSWSGAATFSILTPFTVATGVGYAAFLDSGFGYFPAMCFFGSSRLDIYVLNCSSTYGLGNIQNWDVPFEWVAGDVIEAHITFEI